MKLQLGGVTPPFWKRGQTSPARVIILGFLLLILAGALLLMLPISTRAPGGAGFLEALFTATSATCVTGLVVHDTMQYWSEFGQAVILLLIQIGGMGVVTVAVAIFIFSGKRIGLKQRWVMQESISAPQVGGIIRMTGFILRTALAIEALGALLLAVRFCPQFGLWKGLWYAVFHAVSAFCNAGFDLMGSEVPYSSLTAYGADPLVCLTVAGLIIVGGIGFSTWQDVAGNGRRLRQYRLQSKLILLFTVLLLAGGTLYFGLYEFGLPQWEGLDSGERALAAFFQAVSPRTAGFNSDERAGPAGDHFADAHRRFPRFHRRRLQNHDPGRTGAECMGGVSPPQQCRVLRTAASGCGAAQCQRHLLALPHPLFPGRGTDLLHRQRSAAGCPL